MVLVAAACSSSSSQGEPDTPTTTTAATVATTTTTTAPPVGPVPVPVALRLDRRTGDAATADFEAVVQATLTDPRGWQQAGFAFSFTPDAPYTVVLAEGPVVHELCKPYDVGGRFSCQNGPVVALNADRWRHATRQWTGDLATYKQMLVNHEVGHLLGQHHPAVHCPKAGERAPVMAQQSTELDGCLPNPWPLPHEVACAARHDEPLAPGYEPNPTSAC